MMCAAPFDKRERAAPWLSACDAARPLCAWRQADTSWRCFELAGHRATHQNERVKVAYFEAAPVLPNSTFAPDFNCDALRAVRAPHARAPSAPGL
eukprot:3910354-Prymnesium_polylepis.1